MTISTADLDDLETNINGADQWVGGANTGIAANGRVFDSIAKINAQATSDFDQHLATLGFEPPIAFTSSILVDRTTLTVEESTNVFAPLVSEIPFTTTGVFDASQWYLITDNLPSQATNAGKVLTTDATTSSWTDNYMAARETTTAMIAATDLPLNSMVRSEGFTTSNDGGDDTWKHNGVTGQTASQTPAQVGGDGDKFNDGSGNQFQKIFNNSFKSLGDTFPAPKAGNTITRVAERVFTGQAAEDAAGTADKLDGATFIGDPALDINSFYLEQGAQNINICYYGGIGVTSGAQSSARYAFLNTFKIWATGISVTVNERVGFEAKIYTAGSTGTTGGTPPTHSSGTVSDGNIDFTFVEGVQGTPIGNAAVILADVADARGAWARYTEAVRASTGGTVFAEEIVVKNKGSDTINNPYNELAGSSTIGHFFAGGGDASLGAPTNPSTCAIVIGRNAESWNKGIVFGEDSITGTDGVSGTGTAIAMARGHQLEWFFAGGNSGARIKSDVDAASSSVSLLFDNNTFFVKGHSGENSLEVQSVASSVNFVRFGPGTVGVPPNLRAVGTDANIDLRLRTTGTGVLRFGTRAAIAAETVTGFITIKDDGGTSRKLAVVS